MAGPNATPIPPVILIGLEVLDRITADAARYAGKSERGGIFIGLRRGPHIEINEATLPMRWDLGSMFAFRRSSRGHQSVALRRWRDSARTMDWVGEWHSHPPFSSVSPSRDDRILMEHLTTVLNRDGEPAVMIIIGSEEEISFNVRSAT